MNTKVTTKLTEREMLLTLLHDYNYVITYNHSRRRYIVATTDWRHESEDFNECITVAYKHSVKDTTVF